MKITLFYSKQQLNISLHYIYIYILLLIFSLHKFDLKLGNEMTLKKVIALSASFTSVSILFVHGLDNLCPSSVI